MRSFLAALLLAGLALGVPASGTDAHTCTPDPNVGVSGRLILPRGSGLVSIDLPGREARVLPITPSSGVAGGVARSPDGSLLAVPRFWRPPQHQVGGQDILVVGQAGGAPVTIMERGRPGEVLGAPAWLPDGSLIYERRVLSGSNEAVRIERARPGEPGQVLAEDAASPGVSPDGALLALVRFTDRDRLYARPVDGGPERLLVDRPQLLSMAFPRFSPDGAWLAFTAAADEGVSAPAARSTPFGPRTAYAHGNPWDVWVVRPDGSELRRVTSFADDDSSVAWSPDGRWLATLSAEAVHVVAVDGSASYCVTNEGGYGSLEWLP